MITAEQEEELIEYGRRLIAERVAGWRVQAGVGAEVSGDGTSVSVQPVARDEVERQRIVWAQRDAISLIVEQVGPRIYINFPPVHGVVPEIDGDSIYDSPRPFLAATNDDSGIYVKVSYTRTSVAIPSDPAGGIRRPGLLVSNVAVEIELHPDDSPPSNVTPADPNPPGPPGTDVFVVPFEGNWVKYWQIGELVDGQALVINFPFPDLEYIGGFHITSNGAFDGVDGWQWTDGTAAP